MSNVRQMIEAIFNEDFDGAREALKVSLADYMSGRAYVSNSDLFGPGYKDDYTNPNVEDELKQFAALNGGVIRKHDKTGVREEAEEEHEYKKEVSSRLKDVGHHLKKGGIKTGKDLEESISTKKDWSKVNKKTIELDGVDKRDYPDFSDAYVSYAEWKDGTPLTDSELDAYTNDNGDVVNELAHESLH